MNNRIISFCVDVLLVVALLVVTGTAVYGMVGGIILIKQAIGGCS